MTQWLVKELPLKDGVLEKNHHEKINIKERRFAIRSAVAATTDKEIVENRGHELGDLEQVPIIVEDDLESVKTTKQTREIFESLGVYDDIIRAKEGKRIRAGRGKTRGRKYKKVTGPLVVVGEDKGISLGARNHSGVDVVVVDKVILWIHIQLLLNLMLLKKP